MQTPEKPRRTIEALLLICIVVLVITNLRLNTRLTHLENSLNNIAIRDMNNMHDIRHSLSEFSNRIDNVGEQLLLSARLTFDEAALIQRYNKETAFADVEVSFYLREHNLGDTVGVIARGRSGDTHTAEASFTAGRFVADMTLPVQDNFTFSFTASGETITTGELMQLDLADMLCRRFTYWVGQGHSSGHGPGGTHNTILLSPTFTNETQGNEALEVVSLNLIVETETAVIRNWDLMPYLGNVGDAQVFGAYWDFNYRTAHEIAAGVREFIYDDRATFAISVGEDEDVMPGETIIARLVIYDNLGIRYEQIDMIFVPTTTHMAGSRGRPMPVAVAPVQQWHFADGYERWGFIRMVE